MSTYTTNYNLEKPESNDDFKDFRSNYNSNMDIIDANLGGGGSGNVDDVLVNGVSVVDGNHDAQITSYKEVTQAEYDALPATKLTDGIAYFIKDAGGGGGGSSSHNYSTTEQVIGTWIDGKPLYQITFELSTSMTIPNNSWQSIGVNPTNGEKIINCWGMTEDYSCAPFLGWMDGTTFKVQSARSNSGSYSVKWVTVQYTKTTDV